MIFTQNQLSQHDQTALMEIVKTISEMPPLINADSDTRKLYNEVISSVTSRNDMVVTKSHRFGGIEGTSIAKEDCRADAMILYVHGGGYAVGSDAGYINYVSQIVAKNRISAFIPNYSLAPEHPFPAGFEDVIAAYDDIWNQGIHKIIVMGDSAGGGLALSVARQVSHPSKMSIALSPWTDLTLSSASCSMNNTIDKDFILSTVDTAKIAENYLGNYNATDERISPLFNEEPNCVPTLIHVGSNEILLDDSIRYAQKNANVRLYIWQDLFHVFPLFDQLEAAEEANTLIYEFIQANI